MATDENRSLIQKIGSTGMLEIALASRLAKKSKEVNDLTARFEATRASRGVKETRIRDEFAVIRQETHCCAQAEHAHADVADWAR